MADKFVIKQPCYFSVVWLHKGNTRKNITRGKKLITGMEIQTQIARSSVPRVKKWLHFHPLRSGFYSLYVLMTASFPVSRVSSLDACD